MPKRLSTFAAAIMFAVPVVAHAAPPVLYQESFDDGRIDGAVSVVPRATSQATTG
jgi:hypothetical protein